MNVSLTPKLEKWVREKVESGFYQSSSEVIRDALRVLYLFEEEKVKKFERLRSDLVIGVVQLKAGKSQKFDKRLVKRIKREGTHTSNI